MMHEIFGSPSFYRRLVLVLLSVTFVSLFTSPSAFSQGACANFTIVIAPDVPPCIYPFKLSVTWGPPGNTQVWNYPFTFDFFEPVPNQPVFIPPLTNGILAKAGIMGATGYAEPLFGLDKATVSLSSTCCCCARVSITLGANGCWVITVSKGNC